MKCAVLVDGVFFVKKYVSKWRRETGELSQYLPGSQVADVIHKPALSDIHEPNKVLLLLCGLRYVSPVCTWLIFGTHAGNIQYQDLTQLA